MKPTFPGGFNPRYELDENFRPILPLPGYGERGRQHAGRNRPGKKDGNDDAEKKLHTGFKCKFMRNKITERQMMTVLAMTSALNDMEPLATSRNGRNLTFGYDFRDDCDSSACGATQIYSLTHRSTAVKTPPDPPHNCHGFQERFECAMKENATREKFRAPEHHEQQIAPASILLGAGQKSIVRYATQHSEWGGGGGAPIVDRTMESNMEHRSHSDNEDAYPTFLPTPTDVGEALYDILQHFNWSYVGLITSIDNKYLAESRNALLKVIRIRRGVDRTSVCLAVDELLSPSGIPPTYNLAVQRLKEKPRVRVVIFLGGEKLAKSFLLEAAKSKVSDLTFIGLAMRSMGDAQLLVDERIKAILFLGQESTPWARRAVSKFLDLLTITPTNMTIPPSLKPYWSKYYRCSYCSDSHLTNSSAVMGGSFSEDNTGVFNPKTFCFPMEDVCSPTLRRYKRKCTGTELEVSHEALSVLARFVLLSYFDGLRLVTGALRRAFPTSIDWHSEGQAIKLSSQRVKETLEMELSQMRSETNNVRLVLGSVHRGEDGLVELVHHGEKCQSFRGKLADVTIERVSTKKIQKKMAQANVHTAFFTWTWRASFTKLTNDHVSWCLFV